METNKIAIVTIAYNRVDSLRRLLDSLNNVDFENDRVPLIISIDYSGSSEVFKFAKAFYWKHGEKRIIQHESNLGLKNHVLSCGDLVEDFDAIVVLEDDLIVSESMYYYVRGAVQAYAADEKVEAVSLYAKIWSETAYKIFSPEVSVFDTYFIQTAESLGQIWFKEKWKRFRKWYDENSSTSFESNNIPRNVQEWDQKSWKKFHIKYCIENDLFTAYPYQALSTCMGDVGEHTKSNTFVSQVPIVHGVKKTFSFARFEQDSSIKYDAFLERLLPGCGDVCMDLYGWKKDFTGYQYVISSRILNYAVIKSYGLALRPHEDNIIQDIPGTDFFKYDLSREAQNNRKQNRERLFEYYHFSSFAQTTRQMLFNELVQAVMLRIKRKLKQAFSFISKR